MSIHDGNLVVRRLLLMYNAYVSVPFHLFNHLLGYFTHNQGFFLSFLSLGIKKLFITRKVFARFMVYQNLKITCCPAFGSRFSQLFFLPWVCPKNLRGTSVSTSQWELPPPPSAERRCKKGRSVERRCKKGSERGVEKKHGARSDDVKKGRSVERQCKKGSERGAEFTPGPPPTKTLSDLL